MSWVEKNKKIKNLGGGGGGGRVEGLESICFGWYYSIKIRLPTIIYLFKAYSRTTRKMFSKLSINTPERLSTVFIVSSEDISYLFLVFLQLTWNHYVLAGSSVSTAAITDRCTKIFVK